MNPFSRWFGVVDAGERTLVLTLGERSVPVEVVPSPRARRLTLRADAVRGVVRVSLPPRAKRAEAEAFVTAHHGWIAARVARWPVAVAFVPGATIPFDGATLTLDWAAGRPARVARDGDRLVLGGSAATVPGRTMRWLRAAALADLAPATIALAARLGRTATVAVRDPASRWGSCAASGAINYSWRLILAPPAVRQSVVAHEVAHLVHPNHGAAFWALAGDLTHGDLAVARAWLKRHGAGLHWVGRDA
jgi:predicted metal-dependent hydrolase